MSLRHILAVFVVAACGKGGPAQQTAGPVAKPEAAPTAPEEKPVAAAPPDSDEMSITSKSPEAVAHFKQGRDLADNLRNAESVEHFKKAVELDPDFALATAYLSGVTPGREGFTLIDRAVELAKGAPEPERAFIEAQQALAYNDREKAAGLLRKVVAAKPKDWRAQLALAQLAFADENWDEAVSASQKALAASPKNPQPYNYIAYGYAWQGRWDDAIAAAQKQVELLPGEPNPQDSLGEILLAAGRIDAALAAFEKAAELSPKFTFALVGAAESHMYNGQWKEGYETLKKAHDAAPRPQEAIAAATSEMWALAGQGQLPKALKVSDAIEKAALDAKLEGTHAFAALNRAVVLAIAGKRADALKLVDVAYDRARKADLPAPVMRGLMLGGESVRLYVAWKAKKAADAEKAYASLEAEVKKAPLSRADRSTLDFGQGLLALTKGDAKAAVESMKKCSQFDNVCRFTLVEAQRAAGEKAGAADTLAKLKASPRRDDPYLYYWSAAR